MFRRSSSRGFTLLELPMPYPRIPGATTICREFIDVGLQGAVSHILRITRSSQRTAKVGH